MRLLERHRLSEKRPAREGLLADRACASLRCSGAARGSRAAPRAGRSCRAPRPRSGSPPWPRASAPPATACPVSAATSGLPSRKRSKKSASNTRTNRPKSSALARASFLRSNPPQKILGERDVRTTPRTAGSSWASSAASLQRGRELRREGVRLAAAEREDPDAAPVLDEEVGRGVDRKAACGARAQRDVSHARGRPERNRSRTRRSSVSSGWNVAAVTLPLRTSTGSPSRRASTSTAGSTARDPRGADEDGLERLVAEGGAREVRQAHDGRVELPAVGVPHDGHREEAEPLRRRPLHVARRGGSPPRRCRGRGRRGPRRSRIASSIPVPSMRIRNVVDSPPGITRPVGREDLVRAADLARARRPPAGARRRCASKSP